MYSKTFIQLLPIWLQMCLDYAQMYHQSSIFIWGVLHFDKVMNNVCINFV